MNNCEILENELCFESLTDEIYREEAEREDRGEGLYATDLSGIVSVFGREGFYKIVRYCRENDLKPIFKAIPHVCDGGTVTFEEH